MTGQGAPVRRLVGLIRRLPTVAFAVLAVAIVITVIAAISEPRAGGDADSPAPVSETTGPVDDAERALASGDVTRAAEFAARALAIDPGNERARRVAARAAAAALSPAGSAPATRTPEEAPVDDARFLEEVGDITSFLPAEFEGYDMSSVAALGGNADVSGMPRSTAAQTFRIAWGVRDRKNAQAAASYIKKTTMELFPKSPDEGVLVDGVPAYFGTDGRELASVVYRRGRFVFEVVVVAARPGRPERLKELALAAAQAFADAPPSP